MCIYIYIFYFFFLIGRRVVGTREERREGRRGWEEDLVEDISVWHSPARQPFFCGAVCGLSIQAI